MRLGLLETVENVLDEQDMDQAGIPVNKLNCITRSCAEKLTMAVYLHEIHTSQVKATVHTPVCQHQFDSGSMSRIKLQLICTPICYNFLSVVSRCNWWIIKWNIEQEKSSLFRSIFLLINIVALRHYFLNFLLPLIPVNSRDYRQKPNKREKPWKNYNLSLCHNNFSRCRSTISS